MDKVPGRVAQIFVWKQGPAPDIEYARQVLRVASPEAYLVLDRGTPLLQLFSVMCDWTEDPCDVTEDDVFGVNLIPHTWEVTTLGELGPGVRVNLEIDMLARYLARWRETA